MKTTCIQRRYVVELTRDEFKKSTSVEVYQKTDLATALAREFGAIKDVKYGTCIYYTLNADEDSNQLRLNIQHFIKKYIEELTA